MIHQIKIKKIFGTGGIGSGIIFKLEGNHDLGRNETRMAARSEQRDYCKQHIILHYLTRLIRDLRLQIEVFPIGAVGNDNIGLKLLQEMQAVGMNLRYVKKFSEYKTLFAVCYQFPDGSGGNFTEKKSACDGISPIFIQKAETDLRTVRNRGLILAAPEVPLKSRIKLLKLGTRYNAFRVASFISAEIPLVRKFKILKNVDLISLNEDEAAALGGIARKRPIHEIVRACLRFATSQNPEIKIFVTHGAQGAFCCIGEKIEFQPAFKVSVKNTAGAGDAFLAGVLIGCLLNFPWISKKNNSCLLLGSLLGSLSTTSPDTINFDIRRRSINTFAHRHGLNLSL